MTTPSPMQNNPTCSTPADDRHYWESPGTHSTSAALTEVECWALAATQATGRLGFFCPGVLDIFPVNYLVMANHVYFRTSTDGAIATSYLAHAAFQIDHIDRQPRSGWTVLINGAVTQIKDSNLLTELWGKAIDEPWAPGPRNLFLRVTPTLVRGRRIGIAH